MKNHSQTRRGRQIERLLYARLQRGPQSASQLVVTLTISEHGVRNALLRLQARGLIVCGLDASVEGFPRRVWRVNTLMPAPATGHAA